LGEEEGKVTVSIRIPDGEIVQVGDIRVPGVEHPVTVVNHAGLAIEFVVHGPGVGVIEIKKAEKKR
jgi:hypothetical protein